MGSFGAIGPCRPICPVEIGFVLHESARRRHAGCGAGTGHVRHGAGDCLCRPKVWRGIIVTKRTPKSKSGAWQSMSSPRRRHAGREGHRMAPPSSGCMFGFPRRSGWATHFPVVPAGAGRHSLRLCRVWRRPPPPVTALLYIDVCPCSYVMQKSTFRQKFSTAVPAQARCYRAPCLRTDA